MSFRFNRRQKAAPYRIGHVPPGIGVDEDAFLMFQALTGDSGVSNLSTVVSVNGFGVSAVARYEGRNASAAGWTATLGENLALAGLGSAPTFDVLTPSTDASEKAVAFANGQLFRCASGSFANPGTDDFIIEAFVRLGQANGSIVSKLDVNGYGFSLVQSSTTAVALTLTNATATRSVSSPGIAADAWVHFIGFVDRSDVTGGVALYANAAAGVPAGASGLEAAFSDAQLAVGGSSNGTSLLSTAHVAYVAFWHAPNLFPGSATNATVFGGIAKERLAYLSNVRANYGRGTRTPLVMTRSTSGYLDRVVNKTSGLRQLFFMGANFPRYIERQEVVGGEYIKGFQGEPQSTNLLVRSEEFENASWTKTNCTITANTSADPIGTSTADGIVADAVLGRHSVSQAVTLTATPYELSTWARKGASDFLILENSTIANGACWFNLATGALGTRQAGVTEAIIEAWGGGLYRCAIRFVATVAAHTMVIGAASADNTLTFSGDGVSIYTHIFGAQVEVARNGTGAPSSYIPTTAGTATRTVDALQYVMDDGNFEGSATGSLVVTIMGVPRTLTGSNLYAQIGPANGNTIPSSIRLDSQNPAGNQAHTQMNRNNAAEYELFGNSNTIDGEAHTVKTTWATNLAKLFVDGVQQGLTDTSVTPIPAQAIMLIASGTNVLVGNIVIRRDNT